jgi:uncharacterized protein (TIGR00255 family)
VRASDGFASLEPRVDDLIRRFVRRGTVQVDLRVIRDASPDNFKLNEVVLSSYQNQLHAIYERLQLDEKVRLENLLLLPGVVDECLSSSVDADAEWPTIKEALVKALENLTRMRSEEGQAMASDLQANCRTIATELEQVEKRAPLVVEHYRNRITDRLNRLLAEYDVEVEASDVVREIGLFAERSDISEEIVRLRSHLEQFQSIMQVPEGGGRKLDFVTQEMFREANTIGSKANDAEIGHHVIEIKAAVERIREMIQNIE